MTSLIRSQVHGGVLDDQMIEGSLSFFEMSGTSIFEFTISNGSVVIPGLPTYGGTNTIGTGRPVPRSAADLAFQVLLEKVTLVQIQLIDNDTILFVVESGDNGWDTTNGVSSDAAANMTTEVQALSNQTVPDTTGNGTIVDMGTVTITEKDFILVP